MSVAKIQYHVAREFNELQFTPNEWDALLKKQSDASVFLTWHYQKAWWDSYGRGKLMLICITVDGKLTAIAPLFLDEGLIYFVGSGGSDYLNFIGVINDISIIELILTVAITDSPLCKGFLFYHVDATSPTKTILAEVSEHLGYRLINEGEMIAPFLNIIEFPEKIIEAINKKSLVRHENWFKRNGKLEIKHLSKGKEILPALSSFFEQHISRWTTTPFPSLFTDPKHCDFYIRLAEHADASGWLLFSIVSWNDKPVAYHFGFLYNGTFLWYKPSFDISLSKLSPGEVLLRNLLTNSKEKGAHIFDFGLGEESFKNRFATNKRKIENIGLYPANSLK